MQAFFVRGVTSALEETFPWSISRVDGSVACCRLARRYSEEGRITNKETDQKSGPHCSYFPDPSTPLAAGWTRPTPTGGRSRTRLEPDNQANYTLRWRWPSFSSSPLCRLLHPRYSSLSSLESGRFSRLFSLRRVAPKPYPRNSSDLPVIPVVRDPNELPTELSSSHETFNTCKTVRAAEEESTDSLYRTPQNVSRNVIPLKSKRKNLITRAFIHIFLKLLLSL